MDLLPRRNGAPTAERQMSDSGRETKRRGRGSRNSEAAALQFLLEQYAAASPSAQEQILHLAAAVVAKTAPAAERKLKIWRRATGDGDTSTAASKTLIASIADDLAALTRLR